MRGTWDRDSRKVPRHLQYLAVFLVVVLVASCAFLLSRAATQTLAAVNGAGSGAGSSKTHQAPAVQGTVRVSHDILFIGDSLTAGRYALNQAHSYAVLTASALHESYKIQSHNGGTAVETADNMKANTGPAVPSDALVAVIELGTNDVVASGETLAQFRTAYDYILTRVHHDAPQAKFVCLGTWRAPAQGRSYDATIRSDCASLVGGSYMALSSFYLNAHYRGPGGRVTAFGTSDDFHPNNAGHQAIAIALLAAMAS